VSDLRNLTCSDNPIPGGSISLVGYLPKDSLSNGIRRDRRERPDRESSPIRVAEVTLGIVPHL
jgi:hypothetical protein